MGKIITFENEHAQIKQQYERWTKHHKTIGTHVMREYADGRKVYPKRESVKTYIIENEDKLKKKYVKLYSPSQDGLQDAIDYYLPLNNTSYQETDIPYYSVGASNTKQRFYIRLTFLIEDVRVIFDYSFKSSGSYAASFNDKVSSSDSIRDIVREIAGKKDTPHDTGITVGSDEDYLVVGIGKSGQVEQFEIEEHELIQSFVGIELYDFKMKITE